MISTVLQALGIRRKSPTQCYCGLQFGQIQSQADCKWPHKRITYYENMSFSGMTREQVAAAYDQAFQQWADVADIEPVRVDSPDKANVVARHGWIDIRGFTLAWSGLPCGVSANAQLSQKYDTMERWTYNFLVEVACHEIGHALGLPHLGSGTLMAAFANGLTKPQAKDIQEIQRRYGPPKPKPTPEPEPAPEPEPNPNPQPEPEPNPSPTPGPDPKPAPSELKLDAPMVELSTAGGRTSFEFDFKVPSTGWFNWGTTTVMIRTQGPLDTVLTLSQDGTVIDKQDDNGLAKNGMIRKSLYGGDYKVLVEVKSGSQGSYWLEAKKEA